MRCSLAGVYLYYVEVNRKFWKQGCPSGHVRCLLISPRSGAHIHCPEPGLLSSVRTNNVNTKHRCQDLIPARSGQLRLTTTDTNTPLFSFPGTNKCFKQRNGIYSVAGAAESTFAWAHQHVAPLRAGHSLTQATFQPAGRRHRLGTTDSV